MSAGQIRSWYPAHHTSMLSYSCAESQPTPFPLPLGHTDDHWRHQRHTKKVLFVTCYGHFEAIFGPCRLPKSKPRTRRIIHLSYRPRSPSISRHYFRFLSAMPATADVIKHTARKSNSSHALDIWSNKFSILLIYLQSQCSPGEFVNFVRVRLQACMQGVNFLIPLMHKFLNSNPHSR